MKGLLHLFQVGLPCSYFKQQEHVKIHMLNRLGWDAVFILPLIRHWKFSKNIFPFLWDHIIALSFSALTWIILSQRTFSTWSSLASRGANRELLIVVSGLCELLREGAGRYLGISLSDISGESCFLSFERVPPCFGSNLLAFYFSWFQLPQVIEHSVIYTHTHPCFLNWKSQGETFPLDSTAYINWPLKL